MERFAGHGFFERRSFHEVHLTAGLVFLEELVFGGVALGHLGLAALWSVHSIEALRMRNRGFFEPSAWVVALASELHAFFASFRAWEVISRRVQSTAALLNIYIVPVVNSLGFHWL